MPPEETVLAFAEVEGVRDALVGTTAVNSVVVWSVFPLQLNGSVLGVSGGSDSCRHQIGVLAGC